VPFSLAVPLQRTQGAGGQAVRLGILGIVLQQFPAARQRPYSVLRQQSPHSMIGFAPHRI